MDLKSKSILSVAETVRNMYNPKPVQPVEEASMMTDTGKVVHNCAKHVEHAEWGKGTTMSEEHAAPDADGNIEWYDVLFDHGLEKAVPTANLNILVSESHGHPVKKKKMAAEALHPNQQVLDVHEPEKDKLTADDFKKLRAGKKAKMKEDIDVEDSDLDLEFTEAELDAIAEAYMGFTKTTKALASKGAKNPEALAAYIGRKKYGKEKFQAAAAAGKKLG